MKGHLIRDYHSGDPDVYYTSLDDLISDVYEIDESAASYIYGRSYNEPGPYFLSGLFLFVGTRQGLEFWRSMERTLIQKYEEAA